MNPVETQRQAKLNPKRILIVDDETRVAFFLKEGLEGLGNEYQIHSTGSAELALKQMSQHPFDLLVVDFRLPGLNGLDLLKQVRSISPRTKTILITAYGSTEIREEAYRLHACRYLDKPFHIEDLMRAVQSALP